MGSGGARARLGAGPRRGAWSRGHTCRLLAPARAGHCPGGRGCGEEGRLLPGRRFGRAALTTSAAPRPGVWQVLQGAVRGPPQ